MESVTAQEYIVTMPCNTGPLGHVGGDPPSWVEPRAEAVREAVREAVGVEVEVDVSRCRREEATSPRLTALDLRGTPRTGSIHLA